MRRLWRVPTSSHAQFLRAIQQQVGLLVQSRTLGRDGQPARRELELTRNNASLEAVWSQVQAQQPLPQSVLVLANFHIVDGRVERITFSAGHLVEPLPRRASPDSLGPLTMSRRPVPVERIRRFREDLGRVRNSSMLRQPLEDGLEGLFGGSGQGQPSGMPSRSQGAQAPIWPRLAWADDELREMVEQPDMPVDEQARHVRSAINILSQAISGWSSGGSGISGVQTIEETRRVRDEMITFYEEHYRQTYQAPPPSPTESTPIQQGLTRGLEWLHDNLGFPGPAAQPGPLGTTSQQGGMTGPLGLSRKHGQ